MTNQFTLLKEWIPSILEAIKKEIKMEAFPGKQKLYQTYFGFRSPNRVTTKEVFEAFQKELIQGNPDLSEWVVNRWVFRHGDLYEHFAERLASINPDFSQITSLTPEESQMILEGAKEAFGPIPVYLFAVLNAVVFPPQVIQALKRDAETQ